MSEVEDNFADLIARYAPGSAYMLEMAFLAMQSPEKQAVVEERLRVFDEYLSTEHPSVADVDAAASKIGVSRRQFYRLLAKFRTDGPVRGLVPGLQQVSRSSAARDGLVEPLEAILINTLRKDPDAKIAKLARVLAKYAEWNGLAPPSEWKLRHRVHALRAAGIGGDKASFGSSMLVDQIMLELPVQDLEVSKYCAATLIVDRHTRLIAGAGVTVGDGIALGLQQALFDFSARRIVGFQEQHFPIASNLKEMTWVVPPGLEDAAKALLSSGDRSSPAIEVIDAVARRHGDRLMRVLGDRLGPYNFRTRTDLGIMAEIAPGKGVSAEHAFKVVHYAVDAWNKKLSLSLPKVGNENMPKHIKRLSRVGAQLQSVFGPVLDAVDNRFQPTDFFPS